MKDFWTKFSCTLTGWNYTILNECSEASRKALHRYTGAILLMMLMWGFIGYCMAKRYFDLSGVAPFIVALCFSVVILLIERQIILLVGRNIWSIGFRFLLAVCMSLIGATIIDQYMFGKDIDAAMHKEIEERTDEQLTYRQRIIDLQTASFNKELDSLQMMASKLSNEIAQQPMVKTTTYSKQATGQIDSEGNPVIITTYNQQVTENPKHKDLERVNNRIIRLQEDLLRNSNSLQTLRDSLYAQNERNIGLLTELKVTLSKQVIFSSAASTFFYFVVLFFFLLIELLIVSGKMFNKSKCDYEALIEILQERRINSMCAVIQQQNNEDPLTTEK